MFFIFHCFQSWTVLEKMLFNDCLSACQSSENLCSYISRHNTVVDFVQRDTKSDCVHGLVTFKCNKSLSVLDGKIWELSPISQTSPGQTNPDFCHIECSWPKWHYLSQLHNKMCKNKYHITKQEKEILIVWNRLWSNFSSVEETCPCLRAGKWKYSTYHKGEYKCQQPTNDFL